MWGEFCTVAFVTAQRVNCLYILFFWLKPPNNCQQWKRLQRIWCMGIFNHNGTLCGALFLLHTEDTKCNLIKIYENTSNWNSILETCVKNNYKLNTADRKWCAAFSWYSYEVSAKQHQRRLTEKKIRSKNCVCIESITKHVVREFYGWNNVCFFFAKEKKIRRWREIWMCVSAMGLHYNSVIAKRVWARFIHFRRACSFLSIGSEAQWFFFRAMHGARVVAKTELWFCQMVNKNAHTRFG